jgi:hypothetical protein
MIVLGAIAVFRSTDGDIDADDYIKRRELLHR